MTMQTMQIRLTDKQIRFIDGMVRKGVYPNRSEAARDAIRRLLDKPKAKTAKKKK